jgi:hypothetical protein
VLCLAPVHQARAVGDSEIDPTAGEPQPSTGEERQDRRRSHPGEIGIEARAPGKLPLGGDQLAPLDQGIDQHAQREVPPDIKIV